MTELAGMELRAAVAERVLGRKVRTITNDDSLHAGELCRTYSGGRDYIGNGGLVFDNEPGDLSIAHEVPHYETDIAAAMEVVEAMRARGYSFLLNIPDPAEPRTWWAEFADTTSIYDDGLEYQDTAPLAICRAALAALEEAQ
jgi:hypothetical protein